MATPQPSVTWQRIAAFAVYPSQASSASSLVGGEAGYAVAVPTETRQVIVWTLAGQSTNAASAGPSRLSAHFWFF
jgi:hypothetical protein